MSWRDIMPELMGTAPQYENYPPRTRIEAANRVVSAVAWEFGITSQEITANPGRHKIPVQARREAVRRVRRLGFSYPELGEFFGKRDHSTMIYYCRDVKGHG